jgi:hypothetical protein
MFLSKVILCISTMQWRCTLIWDSSFSNLTDTRIGDWDRNTDSSLLSNLMPNQWIILQFQLLKQVNFFTSRQGLEPVQLLIHWIPNVEQLEHEPSCSYQLDFEEIRNVWSVIPMSGILYRGKSLWAIICSLVCYVNIYRILQTTRKL